jgi:hypothetical protein
VLARAIEEAGLPTAIIASIKEHAQRVKPPRALFVPFPFGFALGNPDDPAFQHKVLAATLDLFKFNADSAPVLVEFPEDGEAPVQLVQATAARAGLEAEVTTDPADELTAIRGYYERWVSGHDDRTMVGLSGVPQRRWRGLFKYLHAFAQGEDASYDEIPDGVEELRFMRLAADDIKAFYTEARMCQRPDQKNNDLQRWFWTETAAGNMLAKIAERLTGSEDEAQQRAAFGIAR